MKQFFKMTLAVICGILVTSILSIIISSMIFGSIAAGSQPVIAKSGILKIDLSKMTVQEQSVPENPLDGMQGKASKIVGIRQAVKALEIAKSDPAVKFIYLKTDGAAMGIATATEFRKAISDFRSSGKPVIAYIESPSTLTYYLASAADKIYMTSYAGAGTMMVGVNAQGIYLKDLLDKLGVNMQLIRHGKYKSAGEMYTRSSSSPDNKVQQQRMVDSFWESIAGEICESREITKEELNKAIDNLELALPEDFVSHRLVDGLVTRDELEDKLAALAVVENFKNVKMIPLADYATVRVLPNYKTRQKIAVIFANGEIVDGKLDRDVAGDRFAEIIEKARRDSSVKAVVLRVNSPGGSVLASEKIRNELNLLKGVKPLIASYGDYAASGGYWISANCDKIFSDATTLTGSIGVFGLVPDFSKLAKEKLHVNFESTGTNRHGDMYTLARPLDSQEMAFWTKQIENIYDRFTSLVAEGRSLDKDFVDENGQGRVWTGADALKIGLVDEIGTLDDAIRYAAVAAGQPSLDEWHISEMPAVPTTMEMLMALFTPDPMEEQGILLKSLKECKTGKVVARLPYNFEFR